MKAFGLILLRIVNSLNYGIIYDGINYIYLIFVLVILISYMNTMIIYRISKINS